MSEAEKKIEEWIEDGPHGNPDADDSSGIWMVKKLTEAAEFGYQPGYEEAMKEVVEKTANAAYIASELTLVKSNTGTDLL